MKPDNTTPGTGSIESVPRPDSINVKNKLEAKNAVKVESQPIVGASVPANKKPVVNASSAQMTGLSSTVSTTATSNDNTNSFEDNIEQLEASNEGGIESHWIEVAEDVMEKTAEDPYYEDDAQHALSKAYLKKRFGLIIE